MAFAPQVPSTQAVARLRQRTARRLLGITEGSVAPDLSLPHFEMPRLPAMKSPADQAWLAEVHRRGLPAVHGQFAVSEDQRRLHALAFLHPSYWPQGPVRAASMSALEPRGASTLELLLAMQPKAVGLTDVVGILESPEALHAAAVELGWGSLIRHRVPNKEGAPAASEVPTVAVTGACVRSTIGMVHIVFGLEAATAYASQLARVAIDAKVPPS